MSESVVLLPYFKKVGLCFVLSLFSFFFFFFFFFLSLLSFFLFSFYVLYTMPLFVALANSVFGQNWDLCNFRPKRGMRNTLPLSSCDQSKILNKIQRNTMPSESFIPDLEKKMFLNQLDYNPVHMLSKIKSRHFDF